MPGRRRSERSRPRRASWSALLALALIALLAPPAAAAANRAPGEFFGLTAVQPTEDDLEGMGRLGAGSYRFEIPWKAIQKVRGGPYNWSAVDRRVRGAAKAGMKLVPVFFGTPEFFPGGGSLVFGPVRNEEQKNGWRDFVIAAMSRYGAGGEFWQENPELDSSVAPDDVMVWNEPNLQAIWYPGASPREYAALLRVTRRALDAVAPEVRIITGGVYGYPSHPDSMDAEPFLKRVYRQRKTRGIIDAVSVHPYAAKISGVRRQLKSARAVIRDAGDDAGLVVGEIGWATGGPEFSRFVKTRREQAELLERSFELLLEKRRRWKIEAAFWFTYRDFEEGRVCRWCPESGLRDRGGELKPAGRTYRRLVRERRR